MGRVDAKVVLVTGAAGGQGAAEARALAAEGATVIAVDLKPPELGGGVAGRALDVTSEAGWQELGARQIRVNTILPGYIETPMTATAPPAFRAANIEVASLGRTGMPGEVAALVVFLISDESAFISGAEIAVDGGQSAHGGAKALRDAVDAASIPTSEEADRAGR